MRTKYLRRSIKSTIVVVSVIAVDSRDILTNTVRLSGSRNNDKKLMRDVEKMLPDNQRLIAIEEVKYVTETYRTTEEKFLSVAEKIDDDQDDQDDETETEDI